MAHIGRQKTFAYLLSFLTLVGVFVVVRPTSASTSFTTQRASEVQTGTGQRYPFFADFKGGASVASGDVNGDGVDEFVVAAGPTGGPRVSVLNQAGKELTTFFAYDSQNRDGVSVAVGDLDGDGVAEIITAPLAGSKPIIKVFSMNGTLIRLFTAFEDNFTGGLSVAVIPSRGGISGSIVVGSGFGREAEVRMYNAIGTRVETSWSPLGKESSNGVSVAAGWSDTFVQNIIVVGAGQGNGPLVQVFSAATKEKLAQWNAYDPQVKSGVMVGYRNDIVVTGPSVGGGPDVRTFTIRGVLLGSTLVFETNFRGGLNVAMTIIGGVPTTLAVPTTAPMTANGAGKKIVISLKQQTMTLYERGHIVSVRKISSGKWATPTPLGTFAVKNKIPVAYSRAYGLYMENWMAFSADGKYGLHSLPYWKLKNGGKLYEGAAHIGTPVSHGCVRQSLADSKSLYDWTPIGTPVIIQA